MPMDLLENSYWIIPTSLSAFSAILIATYRFLLRRKSLKAFQRDPTIRRIQIGRNHSLERDDQEKNKPGTILDSKGA